MNVSKSAFFSFVVFAALSTGIARCEELLTNGDFEFLKLGAGNIPVRDAFGNAVPASWFQSSHVPFAPRATELIGPENGDPATDSDGTGVYAASTRPPLFEAGGWWSASFPTYPGEELFWSFDFKIGGYLDTNASTRSQVPEGFRIELRSFEHGNPNTGAVSGFAGEQSIYVYVHGYGPDTNGDGLGDFGGYAVGGTYPHDPAQVTMANFNDGRWHTLNSGIFGDADPSDSDVLWKVPSVAAGAAFNGLVSDVRFSVNNFNFVFADQFQFLIDNVSVVRVPEPASCSLLALVIAACLGMRHERLVL